MLTDAAHWAASCICKPNLHAVSHLFACSWRAGVLTLSAQPARATAVSAAPKTQMHVIKLDHQKFIDIQSERRCTMTLPPLTAEVSLYKSSGHYRSASSTRRTSGIVPNQVLPQAVTPRQACSEAVATICVVLAGTAFIGGQFACLAGCAAAALPTLEVGAIPCELLCAAMVAGGAAAGLAGCLTDGDRVCDRLYGRH